MPKRSAQLKLARYQEKIRRLEEKERRRRRQRNDLSDDEDFSVTMDGSDESETPTHGETEIDSFLDVRTLPSAPPHTPAPLIESPPQSPLLPVSEQEADATQVTTVIEPEPTLDPEILMALGTSTSDTLEFGEPIHNSLAGLWPPLLKKGLNKEEKDKLAKAYLIPDNCKLLQAPKLNPEISAAVSEVVRGRDKKITGFQQQLGTATSAVNRAMDLLLKGDEKVQALKHLSDGCRLLSDLHYAFTKDRSKLIIPSLERNFLHIIQDSERDETLFGNNLGEKIKTSKAIERQGHQIRKTVHAQKSSSRQIQPVRPVNQGNWIGPPRYSSSRGARGSQRKATPVARQPYPTNQHHPKNFNQPRSRPSVP